MYSTKQYFIGFFLLLSTAGSSWLALHSSKQALDASQANAPESYMTDATIIRMNSATGLLQDKLYVPYLIHYTLNDITLLTHPLLTIFQATGEPWHLTADHGQSMNGAETVKLWSNVLLSQAQGPQNPPLTITTSAATIFPKQEYAITDQPLVARQPDKMLQAIGMRTYFKTGIVELLSHVHGEYQPSAKTK